MPLLNNLLGSMARSKTDLALAGDFTRKSNELLLKEKLSR
jgi:hypothetical protein